MAQSVERILGKDEVISSILISSSKIPDRNGSGFLLSMNMALLNISKNADIFPQCALFVLINHYSDNRLEHFLKIKNSVDSVDSVEK